MAHVARPKLHPLVANPRLELGTMGYEPIMLPLHQLAIYFGSGKWIRTTDLKVMSLASYLCSTPLFICSQGQIRTDITPRIGNNFPNWGLEPRVTGLHYLTN